MPNTPTGRKGARQFRWDMEFFRRWLLDKYGVKEAGLRYEEAPNKYEGNAEEAPKPLVTEELTESKEEDMKNAEE